ncbi:hypothetical protein DXB25_25125 [Lachnospiraceae bacterium OM02-31]|nr:hypothetical protein DXB25_25125 [Lachnospiraceae bacterium OM02-31]RJW55980.1 hypothetical protein DXB24_17705 [Lachnospiraceae bacterium OM02-3]
MLITPLTGILTERRPHKEGGRGSGVAGAKGTDRAAAAPIFFIYTLIQSRKRSRYEHISWK